MIVVLNIEHIPALAIQVILPAAPGLLQLPQGEGTLYIIVKFTAGAHAVELDHHIDLIVRLPDVVQCDVRGDGWCLCQGHAVVLAQHFPVEFAQIFMDTGSVIILAQAQGRRRLMAVGQAVLL